MLVASSTLEDSDNAVNVVLWDVKTGDQIASVLGDFDPIWSLSFSSDGALLATGSTGGALTVWDVSSFMDSAERLAEDMNSDGVVNIQDLVLVASNLGETGKNTADVNGDGIINILDLVRVAQHFGKSIGKSMSPTPPAIIHQYTIAPKITTFDEPEFDEPERVAASFISADPRAGSTIADKASIVFTFSAEPADVTVNAGTATVVGRTVVITGPFTPGPLALKVTWADGFYALSYTVVGPDTDRPTVTDGTVKNDERTVVGPDTERPTVTDGTVKDGAKDVDPEAINSDGLIKIEFSEVVTGSIWLQTEAGDDAGWIGKVEGNTGCLELVKGKEIDRETTYVIKGKVSDAAGNTNNVIITFVTIGLE